MSKQTAGIGVFARTPELGKVKTRLSPPLSAAEALRLHRALVEDTLARVGRLRSDPEVEPLTLRLLLSRPLDHPEDLELPAGWEVGYQVPGDLGDRLASFFRESLDAGRTKVIALGSDSPTLPLAYLRQALRELETADVVLGPAEDGGYYLLGCRRWVPELFRDIPWGSGGVLSRTLEALESNRRAVRLLSEWYDIDRGEDLERLRSEIEELSAAAPQEVPRRVASALASR